jgi:hypothetical protein
LGKGSDHAIEVATKLDDDPYPDPWAAAPEKALTSGAEIWLSVCGVFDSQKDFREGICHLRMPYDDMFPGVSRQFNTPPVGTAAQDEVEHC